jgi:hypothetical protein
MTHRTGLQQSNMRDLAAPKTYYRKKRFGLAQKREKTKNKR